MSELANKFTSCSIDSSLIIDMTAKRDDGQFWDSRNERGSRELGANAARTPNRSLDWKRATHILSHIIAPPSEKGTKDQIVKAQDEVRQYTQSFIKVYKRQLSMGRHFSHEHPVHASSWCMPEMQELLSAGRIRCRVRCVTSACMTATDGPR